MYCIFKIAVKYQDPDIEYFPNLYSLNDNFYIINNYIKPKSIDDIIKNNIIFKNKLILLKLILICLFQSLLKFLSLYYLFSIINYSYNLEYNNYTTLNNKLFYFFILSFLNIFFSKHIQLNEILLSNNIKAQIYNKVLYYITYINSFNDNADKTISLFQVDIEKITTIIPNLIISILQLFSISIQLIIVFKTNTINLNRTYNIWIDFKHNNALCILLIILMITISFILFLIIIIKITNISNKIHTKYKFVKSKRIEKLSFIYNNKKDIDQNSLQYYYYNMLYTLMFSLKKMSEINILKKLLYLQFFLEIKQIIIVKFISIIYLILYYLYYKSLDIKYFFQFNTALYSYEDTLISIINIYKLLIEYKVCRLRINSMLINKKENKLYYNKQLKKSDYNEKIINIFNNYYNKSKNIFNNYIEFICVFGETSSGKTLLLNNLYSYYKDYIKLNSLMIKVSFVSSTNYIFNLSIKENIVLDNEFDISKFYFILNVVDLIVDFNIENTDEITMLNNIYTYTNKFIITNNGENISKGQKYRILLARELYNEPNILIIDNIFDSIDICVLYKLFINLKSINKFDNINNKLHTVYYSTYNKILLELSDNIIKTVYNKETKLYEFDISNNNNENSNESINKLIEYKDNYLLDNYNYKNKDSNILNNNALTNSNNLDYSHNIYNSNVNYKSVIKQLKKFNNCFFNLFSNIKIIFKSISLINYYKLFKIMTENNLKISVTSKYKLYLTLFLILIIHKVDVYNKYLISVLTKTSYSNQIAILSYISIELSIIFLVFKIIYCVTNFTINLIGNLYYYVIKSNLTFKKDCIKDSSIIFSRLSNDLDKVIRILWIIFKIVSNFSGLLILIIINSYYFPIFILFIPLYIFICIYGFIIYNVPNKMLKKINSNTKAVLSKSLKEYIYGIEVIKEFKYKKILENINNNLLNLNKINVYSIGVFIMFEILYDLLGLLFLSVMIVIYIKSLDGNIYSEHKLFNSWYIAVLSYSVVIVNDVKLSLKRLSIVQNHMVSFNLCVDLINNLESENNKLTTNVSTRIVKIQINNFCYKYDKASKYIIKDLNTEIIFNNDKPLFIIGRTGIGKSTFVNLLTFNLDNNSSSKGNFKYYYMLINKNNTYESIDIINKIHNDNSYKIISRLKYNVFYISQNIIISNDSLINILNSKLNKNEFLNNLSYLITINLINDFKLLCNLNVTSIYSKIEVNKLSKGQIKLITIIRELVNIIINGKESSIFVLDETISEFDNKLKIKVANCLNYYSKLKKIKLIIVTHDESLVNLYAEKDIIKFKE